LAGANLVVEVDGFRSHSTHRAFEHDRRKDATLGAAGVATMRVTWRQIEDEPYAVVARLALARSPGQENPGV
jgi:very-short-patch-repair endonuclease